jgi:hypothetical protein
MRQHKAHTVRAHGQLLMLYLLNWPTDTDAGTYVAASEKKFLGTTTLQLHLASDASTAQHTTSVMRGLQYF